MLSQRLVLLFGFLYAVLREETLCNDSATNPEEDSNSEFTEFVVYENQVLDAQKIFFYQVRGSIECALSCSRHSSCVSFNIEVDEERKTGEQAFFVNCCQSTNCNSHQDLDQVEDFITTVFM